MKKSDMALIVENVDTNLKSIAEGLIQEVEFQQGILKKLKKELKDDVSDVVKVRLYNQTVHRYSGLCKQIEDMIRHGGKVETGENALQRWLEATK